MLRGEFQVQSSKFKVCALRQTCKVSAGLRGCNLAGFDGEKVAFRWHEGGDKWITTIPSEKTRVIASATWRSVKSYVCRG